MPWILWDKFKTYDVKSFTTKDFLILTMHVLCALNSLSQVLQDIYHSQGTDIFIKTLFGVIFLISELIYIISIFHLIILYSSTLIISLFLLYNNLLSFFSLFSSSLLNYSVLPFRHLKIVFITSVENMFSMGCFIVRLKNT